MIEALFSRIAGRPEQDHEAGNGLRHVAALSMTKLADGLIDPKLVLAWLLNALGVPAAFVSALVPIREAGALLLVAGLFGGALSFLGPAAALAGFAAMAVTGAGVALGLCEAE